LRKASYKVKFIEKVEEMIQSTKLNKMVDKFCTIGASPDQLKEIDRQISFMLDAARRHTEGLKENCTFFLLLK